ncbi:MAG: hypothetical protein LJE59_07755 [Chromatiaceae bacterium]|jgi:hypothetical protein|nr:hypothetical protein [Chromatiaceae bacterium]
MAEKTPNIHKTLFFLILVFVPPYFLMFTDEGGRLSDTALLWLLGEDEIKLNVRELNSGFTREDIKKVFSEADWQCAAQATPFGNNLCAAQIGTFNGYPSRIITTYFHDDNISAFKLIYRERYHEQLIGYYIQQLGQPSNVEAAVGEGPDAAPVLEWRLDHGVLYMKKTLGKIDEPTLIWLASQPGA